MSIDDLNPAAAVVDEAKFLKLSGQHRDRGPLHAEHFGEEFVRQGYDVAVASVVRLQQPSAKARRDLMEGVAAGNLIDERDLGVVVTSEKLP